MTTAEARPIADALGVSVDMVRTLAEQGHRIEMDDETQTRLARVQRRKANDAQRTEQLRQQSVEGWLRLERAVINVLPWLESFSWSEGTSQEAARQAMIDHLREARK